MSGFSATFFLDAHADARGHGAPHPALYIQPDGGHSGYVTFQIPSEIDLADRVKVAEALLRGVQEFRDAVVADVEKQRTAEDELAEARAEIARLKAEQTGGAR